MFSLSFPGEGEPVPTLVVEQRVDVDSPAAARASDLEHRDEDATREAHRGVVVLVEREAKRGARDVDDPAARHVLDEGRRVSVLSHADCVPTRTPGYVS